jgi:hypothetical protein
VGGSCIRAGGHAGDVRGFEKEESGRSGSCSGRRHVDDDWNARAQDCSSHGSHGSDEAPGGIDLYQDRYGTGGVGAGNRAVEHSGADGLYCLVEDELLDYRLLSGNC